MIFTLAPGLFVEPHSGSRLHGGRFDIGVSVLQSVPECVVARLRKPDVGLTLEGSDLCGQVRQLAGEVSGCFPIVSLSTHTVRVRAIGQEL